VGLAARQLAFWAALAAFVALTVCVLLPSSPVLDLDSYLAGLHLKATHPGWRPWINGYVILGQRGPATLAVLPVVAWTAWRRRDSQPLVLLGTALIVLNVAVGVVKYATGRVGPWDAADSDVHDIFAGGAIYPSGHVSNAVVLYGLLAWIAGIRWRKAAIAAAAFLSVTVGLGTVYLRTHWFSDVLGGWLAGGMVLLCLPTVLPYAQRGTDRALAAARRRYARRHRRAGLSGQPKLTPVSFSAAAHSRAAVAASFDDREELTRFGWPVSSAGPSGPQ
jgi:undecaprenyl-diphosphatase